MLADYDEAKPRLHCQDSPARESAGLPGFIDNKQAASRSSPHKTWRTNRPRPLMAFIHNTISQMIWNVDTVKLLARHDGQSQWCTSPPGMAGGQGRSAQLWPGQCWLRSSDHLAVFHKYQIQRPREVARQRQLQSFKTLLRLQSHKSCISKSRCSCAQRDTEGLTEEPLVQNKRLLDWGLQHLSIDLLRRGIF